MLSLFSRIPNSPLSQKTQLLPGVTSLDVSLVCIVFQRHGSKFRVANVQFVTGSRTFAP